MTSPQTSHKPAMTLRAQISKAHPTSVKKKTACYGHFRMQVVDKDETYCKCQKAASWLRDIVTFPTNLNQIKHYNTVDDIKVIQTKCDK